VAQKLPRSIWALGIVSLLMDVSSEMIHGLMPVFLVSVLGASTLTVGVIEGIGEATANITKLVSGMISDRTGRRKPLTVLGYGLGTLSKPLFALAPTAGWVLGARFADRVGKGIRGAPRDAMVGDLAPKGMEGAAYGLRQSLDNVGAFVGPGLAMILMWAFAGDFRSVFWVAVVPGVLAVLVLILLVREPERHTERPPKMKLDRAALVRMGAPFWGVVAVGAVLTLARFSEAFVILLAEDHGLALALAPLVLVIIYAVASFASYPAGILSDNFGRSGLLIAGFMVLIFSDTLLALASGTGQVMAGAAFWGLHLGLTQGVLAALVAETAPLEYRATAFGVFNLVSGVALLIASVLAGWLWQALGPGATFTAGAGLSVLGLIGFSALNGKARRKV
jgi:MFS family permease